MKGYCFIVLIVLLAGMVTVSGKYLITLIHVTESELLFRTIKMLLVKQYPDQNKNKRSKQKVWHLLIVELYMNFYTSQIWKTSAIRAACWKNR